MRLRSEEGELELSSETECLQEKGLLLNKYFLSGQDLHVLVADC